MSRPIRVVRSARVATALSPSLPMIRSPSQWPGTARSATSAGRCEMLTMPTIRDPVRADRDCGRRRTRPDRRQPSSSLRSSPWLARKALDRSLRETPTTVDHRDDPGAADAPSCSGDHFVVRNKACTSVPEPRAGLGPRPSTSTSRRHRRVAEPDAADNAFRSPFVVDLPPHRGPVPTDPGTDRRVAFVAFDPEKDLFTIGDASGHPLGAFVLAAPPHRAPATTPPQAWSSRSPRSEPLPAASHPTPPPATPPAPSTTATAAVQYVPSRHLQSRDVALTT